MNARPEDRESKAPLGQLLLSSRQPSRRQVQILSGIAVVLFLAAIMSLPFRQTELAEIHSFIPVVDTMLLLGDLLTATLLFSQASVLRSRALLALATGYLFSALIIIPHALTFPGAFAATGLLGARVSTTIWIYFFWHTGLPLAVIAYARLRTIDEAVLLPIDKVRPAMTASIAGAAALAAVLTVVATVGEPLLPIMMADRITWLSPRVLRVAVVLLGLLAGAMAAVWRGRRSILDLWLLLALWAWFLELSLVLTTSRRYSGGWYTGRTAGLLSGVFVLLMLLWETNRLYARLALSAVTRRREQEGRLLTMNAVAGSIAHDIKQPLTAIVANAHAGRQSIERPPVDMPELAAIFASIAQEGQDAAAVVDRIRAMYRRGGSADRDAVDVNALIRDTTTMLSAELLGHRIALHLNLEEGLPAVLADRLQVQHVFLNLFVNAIDALTAIEGRQRVLLVASSRQASTILVTVADCGTGIDPAVVDRLFEPFVTTKAQGSGMGLPLCRSIIDTHGGRVWAASRHPHGAIFHVQLPHTASAPAPADPLEQL